MAGAGHVNKSKCKSDLKLFKREVDAPCGAYKEHKMLKRPQTYHINHSVLAPTMGNIAVVITSDGRSYYLN